VVDDLVGARVPGPHARVERRDGQRAGRTGAEYARVEDAPALVDEHDVAG